ncbi:MAG: replication-relaxation family protein [Solirubrobacteraceae bacterium]
MADSASVDRGRVVRPRRPSDPSCAAALTDVDHRLLAVVCEHRVVRQDQLQRLFPEVPQRTLRYRTRRLHDLGLVGRSRPYRERGSAPHHHWPTRQADCLANGERAPRGGDRREPNPLFLAHSVALTDLYVTLQVDAPATGLSLFDYRREAAAREPFEHAGRRRALAPDALVILADEHERRLAAFVELDLGTMSHPRLQAKADLYAAYTAAGAWRERHPFLPALLFLTTTEVRALRFLDALESAFAEIRRRGYGRRSLVAGSGALALQPNRLLTEPCLAGLDGPDDLRLLDVLEVARAPYEQAERTNQKRREAWQRKRERLHENPGFARRALARFTGSHSVYVEDLEPVGQQALRLLATSTDELCPQERDALHALVNDLDAAILQPSSHNSSRPSPKTRRAVASLAGFYRERQQRLVEQLAAHNGEGPHLRSAARRLSKDRLLDSFEATQLPSAAENDALAHEEQQQRQLAYLAWREDKARALVRRTGPLARLAHSPEEFYAQLDREYLRTCRSCDETVYPEVDPAPARVSEVQAACHYCHGSPDDTGVKVVYTAPSEGGRL